MVLNKFIEVEHGKKKDLCLKLTGRKKLVKAKNICTKKGAKRIKIG